MRRKEVQKPAAKPTGPQQATRNEHGSHGQLGSVEELARRDCTVGQMRASASAYGRKWIGHGVSRRGDERDGRPCSGLDANRAVAIPKRVRSPCLSCAST